MRVEYDAVKSTKRITQYFSYFRTKEKRTPLYYIRQTILKEIKPKNEITYTVYDNLTMTTNAQNLENEIFIILVDEIIPIDVDEMEVEHTSSISENKGIILAEDSTRVSVVTGYSQENKKQYKIRYQLSSEVIEKISRANKVNFRYYCGPSMITTALNEYKLERLKEMIMMR